VKRALIGGVLVGLAALVGPAQAQTAVALYGGLPGAIVSQTSINARVQGDLVVTFRGDAAAGCAARGLCSYSGTVLVRPRSAQVSVLTYRRGRGYGHLVFVSLGSPDNGYETSARVTRSPGGAGAGGTCADAGNSLFPGSIPAATHGHSLTIRLLGRGGSLLPSRCAGPIDDDLSGASPAVTVPLARVLRGRMTIDLSGTRTFSTHGFAGTVSSTLTMKLGKPQVQSGNGSVPPGIKTRRIRTVSEQLTLVGVRGGLGATVRGTSDPIVCSLLDSCGVNGSLSLSGGVRGATANVTATGPARRPYRDFLAALGLSRSGDPHGIQVFGSVSWIGDVRASMTQAGSACSDTAATGGVGVPFTLGPGPGGGFVGTWRTRCPGPLFENTGSLLSSSPDRAALGHREFTLDVRGRGASSDDGYMIVVHGRLSLRLRRGRITSQVLTQPGG
jgi:hypothetical protein